jgi:hypothetical protein
MGRTKRIMMNKLEIDRLHAYSNSVPHMQDGVYSEFPTRFELFIKDESIGSTITVSCIDHASTKKDISDYDAS